MRILITLLPLISTAAFAAAPPKQTAEIPDIHARAIQEAATTGVKTKSASDVSVDGAGVMRLEDPGLQKIVSDWKWELGLKAQNFLPQGSADLVTGQTYDLSKTGQTVLPILNMGLRRHLVDSQSAIWNLGARFDFGYSSQTTDITFASGAKAKNTRLSSGLAELYLIGGVRLHAIPKFEFEAGIGQGTISYTQAANDDAANFSKQAQFNTWLLGVQYWIKPDWSVGVEQSRRDLIGSNQIGLQADSTSIGTRIMW